MRAIPETLVVLLMGLFMATACGGGDDVGAADSGISFFPDVLEGDASASDAATNGEDLLSDDVAAVLTPLDLAFQVAFTYIGRVAENEGQSDLFLLDPDGGEPRSVTQFIEGEQGEVWSCENSCIVDSGLQWIAVADGPRGENGFFSFGMGRFTDEGIVQMAKASPLQDVVDLHFSDTWVYYSKLIPAAGSTSQYEIWRAELASPANREKLMDFPPLDALEGAQYYGHFVVGASTDQLVLLLPTLGSQSVYLWEDGRLAQLDNICPITRDGHCAGTGSYYSDLDPVAVSTDGRHVAVFATGESELRVLLYDLEDDGSGKYFKDLARVDPTVFYRQHYCEYLEPWQYGLVGGRPVFSPDGSFLYYIGVKDCGTEKPQTDVLELQVARLKEFDSLGEADFRNVTRFPATGAANQVVINGFDISPAGDVVVFTGTPRWGQNEQEIAEGSSRHRNDSEVWLIGTDGTRLEQLTEELRWQAAAPHAMP